MMSRDLRFMGQRIVSRCIILASCDIHPGSQNDPDREHGKRPRPPSSVFFMLCVVREVGHMYQYDGWLIYEGIIFRGFLDEVPFGDDVPRNTLPEIWVVPVASQLDKAACSAAKAS